MVKIPRISRKTAAVETLSAQDGLSEASFPAGRSKLAEKPADDAVLTSNMTGQVTLSGTSYDLQFSRGCLRGISGKNNGHRLHIRSKSFFLTSKRRLDYRNESAFALDAESGYGLRSLQICRNGSVRGRIITDFIFNRNSENCYISCSVDYPDFGENEVVRVSAPLELVLGFADKLSLTSDRIQKPIQFESSAAGITVEGTSFGIDTGSSILRLEYVNSYDSVDFSELQGLSVSCTKRRGKKYLLLTPGGSITPAPSSFYSGVIESFCLKLDFQA